MYCESQGNLTFRFLLRVTSRKEQDDLTSNKKNSVVMTTFAASAQRDGHQEAGGGLETHALARLTRAREDQRSFR